MLFIVARTTRGIPISYYETFVLEEKYGFNKTTRRLFVADLLKALALGTVIGLPFRAAFLWIINWAGSSL